jgi:hypothetical protein
MTYSFVGLDLLFDTLIVLSFMASSFAAELGRGFAAHMWCG